MHRFYRQTQQHVRFMGTVPRTVNAAFPLPFSKCGRGRGRGRGRHSPNTTSFHPSPAHSGSPGFARNFKNDSRSDTVGQNVKMSQLFIKLNEWVDSSQSIILQERNANGDGDGDGRRRDKGRDIALLQSIEHGVQRMYPSIISFPIPLERRIPILFSMFVVHPHSRHLFENQYPDLAQRNGNETKEVQKQSDRLLRLSYKWIDAQLQRILSSVLDFQAACDDETPFLDIDMAFMLTGFLRTMVFHNADRTRKMWFLRSWVDLLLFRPEQQMIEDQRLRTVVMRLRNELLSPRKEDLNKLHATKFCSLAVDAMLTHNHNNPHAATSVLDLLNKIVSTEFPEGRVIRIHGHLLVSVIQKCNTISPQDKWKLAQVSYRRDHFDLNPSAVGELLTQCQEQANWSTANEIIEFVMKNPPLSSSASVMMRILSVKKHGVSPAQSIKFWRSLPEELPSKWHGITLLQILLTAMNARQHNIWTDIAKDILKQADTQHGGSWPSPFFDTTAMQTRFEKLSKFIIKSLDDYGKRHESQEHIELAERWSVFTDDQIDRFGAFSKECKRATGNDTANKGVNKLFK